jgi:uncharacterized protein (TIGR03435 family)
MRRAHQAKQAILSAAIAGLAAASAVGQATNNLTFEVASVKPSPPIVPGSPLFFGPPRGGPGTPDPEQITWSNASLMRVLMTAYDVKAYQVNGPAWLDTERYEIAVKIPQNATKAQVNVMWQNLLAERFGVTLHHEPKEFQVEELVIAKSGSKLKEPTVDPAAELLPGPPQRDKNGDLIGPGMVTMVLVGPNGPSAHTVAKAQPLSRLTEMLTNQMHRPVLDKTGLAGKYDFSLEYTPDMSRVPPPPPEEQRLGAGPPPENVNAGAPDVAVAIQQQLGLRLVSAKARLDVLVIDKAEKVPTEN